MATVKQVTITHTCDKCGKPFNKQDYRFDFAGPGYIDRDDIFVRFDMDIWYGGDKKNADICPACAKEILQGILNKLNG